MKKNIPQINISQFRLYVFGNMARSNQPVDLSV